MSFQVNASTIMLIVVWDPRWPPTPKCATMNIIKHRSVAWLEITILDSLLHRIPLESHRNLNDQVGLFTISDFCARWISLTAGQKTFDWIIGEVLFFNISKALIGSDVNGWWDTPVDTGWKETSPPKMEWVPIAIVDPPKPIFSKECPLFCNWNP